MCTQQHSIEYLNSFFGTTSYPIKTLFVPLFFLLQFLMYLLSQSWFWLSYRTFSENNGLSLNVLLLGNSNIDGTINDTYGNGWTHNNHGYHVIEHTKGRPNQRWICINHCYVSDAHVFTIIIILACSKKSTPFSSS